MSIRENIRRKNIKERLVGLAVVAASGQARQLSRVEEWSG